MNQPLDALRTPSQLARKAHNSHRHDEGSAGPPRANRRRTRPPAERTAIALGVVLLATLLVYLRSFAGGFVFDDHEVILANRYIAQWSFIWKSLFRDLWWFRDPMHLPQSAYFRPVHGVWLGLNYHLFGFHPAGWHAAMVALHLLVVALVLLAARELTGDRRSALAAAALFGLFPLHAEAVSWPSAFPEPAAAAFELAALYFVVRRSDSKGRDLGAALVLFAGALGCHESAVAFALLVAAWAFFFAERARELMWAPLARRIDWAAAISDDGQHCRPHLRELAARGYAAALAALPFVFVLGGYFALRYAVLGLITRPSPANHATLAQVLMTIPGALATYLVLAVMPWLAGPAHRLDIVTRFWSADFFLPLAALSLVATAFGLLIRESPRRRLYLFCAAWMLLAMAPFLNLGGLSHEMLVQDRYLYLPSFGWCVALAEAAVALVGRRRARVRAVAVGGAALLVIYAASLYGAQRFWHDEVALFSRCIESFPGAALWHNRLALALEQRGRLAQAEREMSLALKLDPNDGPTLYDLGMIHRRQGRNQEAAREIAQALELLPNAPAAAYANLAQLYDATGDQRRAEETLGRAAAMPNGAEPAALARAQLRLAHRDAASAEQIARALVSRGPVNAGALVTLGSALALQQRYQEALEAYRRALALEPRDPGTRLLFALTLHNLGRNQAALAECRMVLAMIPQDPNARALLNQIRQELANAAAAHQ